MNTHKHPLTFDQQIRRLLDETGLHPLNLTGDQLDLLLQVRLRTRHVTIQDDGLRWRLSCSSAAQSCSPLASFSSSAEAATAPTIPEVISAYWARQDTPQGSQHHYITYLTPDLITARLFEDACWQIAVAAEAADASSRNLRFNLTDQR